MRYFVFIFLTYFSSSVFAAPYYWGQSAEDNYPSAESACKAIVSTLGGWKYKETVVYGDYAECYASSSGIPSARVGTVRRSGNSCPEGSIYNSKTGSCDAPEPDKCASSMGKTIYNEVDLGAIGSAHSEPPGSVCSGGCQYAFSYEAPTNVYRFVDRADGKKMDHAYGKYRYQANGSSCTQNNSGSTGSVFDQPPSKPPMDTTPTSFSESSCGEWVTSSDGTGTRKCTDVKEYIDPGKLSCTGQSGTLVCYPKSPAPDYEKTDTTTQTSVKPLPTGGALTTTDKDIKTTTCTGAKPCQTSTTEKTTTTETDSDGKDKGTSETCTGADCKAEDKGDKGKDDKGDSGACDIVSNPDGCQPVGSTDGGDKACDAPIACDGDIFQCALLQQQHKDICAITAKPTEQELKEFDQKRLSEIASVQGYQQDLDGEVSGLFSSFQGSATGSQYSGKCFEDQSFDINGTSFIIPFSMVCPYLAWFRFALVAVAYLWAARIINKSF